MTGFWGDGGPYASWGRALRAWAGEESADLAALPPLRREEFAAETWQRFIRQVLDAVDTRLLAWARRFKDAYQEAEDEFSAGRELTQARAGLRSIRTLVDHPGLPHELHCALDELFAQHIRSLQSQLEHSLEQLTRSGTDPAWVELRLRTLRDNAFTAMLDAPPAPSPERPSRFSRLRRPRRSPASMEAGPRTADHWSTDPGTAPGRRIVPD
ncbi:hypothetical protein ACIBI8_35295 [Streptomyces sp. NPDC050529]|uniref:hypothetical protein n=1 Tax=unclassified Streptomyces TaxID=2593676 RepID=UPI002DD8C144|nr:MULTISPECIES: hypothetical protein [unclassified Streptomyces]WRZ81604.1 hypothetical protein OG316_15690 [Streptomyces sp. NBC_01022]